MGQERLTFRESEKLKPTWVSTLRNNRENELFQLNRVPALYLGPDFF